MERQTITTYTAVPERQVNDQTSYVERTTVVVVAPELAGKPLQQISRLSDRHGRPVNPGTFDLADGARIVGLDGHGALDTAFLPLEMQNADVICTRIDQIEQLGYFLEVPADGILVNHDPSIGMWKGPLFIATLALGLLLTVTSCAVQPGPNPVTLASVQYIADDHTAGSHESLFGVKVFPKEEDFEIPDLKHLNIVTAYSTPDGGLVFVPFNCKSPQEALTLAPRIVAYCYSKNLQSVPYLKDGASYYYNDCAVFESANSFQLRIEGHGGGYFCNSRAELREGYLSCTKGLEKTE